jgi:hypothetical protein
MDVKKLGRIHDAARHRVTARQGRYTGRRRGAAGVPRSTVGWEYVHIAVDDATRLAYVEVLDNEPSPRSGSCAAPSRTTPPRASPSSG